MKKSTVKKDFILLKYISYQITDESDYEWLQVTASDYEPDYKLQVATSDYEWLQVRLWVTASDYEWPEVTTSDYNWLQWLQGTTI